MVMVNLLMYLTEIAAKSLNDQYLSKIIEVHHKPHNHSEEKQSKKPKKTVKSSSKSKKIRKK